MRHRQEYYESYEAYAHDQPYNNPYPQGTIEHECYQDGWEQAREDKKQLEWMRQWFE